MTKLEKIEAEIKTLDTKDLRRLSDWLVELQADQWDEQIARDSAAGKLDKLVAEAKADIAAGRIKPL